MRYFACRPRTTTHEVGPSLETDSTNSPHPAFQSTFLNPDPLTRMHQGETFVLCFDEPPLAVVDKVISLVRVKGLSDVSTSTFAYGENGKKYLMSSVLRAVPKDVICPPSVNDVPKKRAAPKKSGKAKKARLDPSRGKNALLRLLNILFSDDMRPGWEASEQQATRRDLDTKAVGGRSTFWQEVAAKMLDEDYDVSNIPSKTWSASAKISCGSCC